MFSAADLMRRVLGPMKVSEPSALDPTEVVGVVPAPRLALLVELGPVEVAVHDGGPAHPDLARLARSELGAVGVEGGDPDEGGGPPARPDAGLERVERGQAHDLGLAVPGGPLPPRALVHGDHRRPLGLAREAPQRLEVVATVGVELDDLVHGGRHDEPARAVLLGDQPAQLLGVDRGVNTLLPPARNVARVVMNVATWNSGPQLRYT